MTANDGWVKVYENGAIEGQSAFKKLSPGGNPASASVTTDIGKNAAKSGPVVRLGAIRNLQNLHISRPFKLARGSKGRAYVGDGIADDVIDAKEIIFSDKIGEQINENIIHPPYRDYPSIDAVTEITKTPLSYKQLTSQNRGSAIIDNINDAYKSIRDNNIAAAAGKEWKHGLKYERWEGVDLHIEYPFSDVSADWVTKKMWPAFERNPQRAFKNDGLIRKVYIHLQDGSVLEMDINGFN